MEKVLVIGVSAGVGKSTFANRLGKLTGIEVIHLDRFYWKPDWVEASSDEFEEKQRQVVARDEWIIEGNYTSTIHIRESNAETIIYLELPLRTCLFRVLKRRIQFHGKTRDDMGEGCNEKIDWAFLKFILTTYGARKKKMLGRLEHYRKQGKKVYHLKSSNEMEHFFNNLPQ